MTTRTLQNVFDDQRNNENQIEEIKEELENLQNEIKKLKKNFNISFLTKYVGEQYMSNIALESSKLDAYFVNDLQMRYEVKTEHLFKSVVFTGLVNNVFNVKYVSNGYFYTYDDTWSDPGQVTTITGAGYYPQAEINFLLGVNLNF